MYLMSTFLAALAGIQLDVVDEGTYRNVGDRQGVARFDICAGAAVEHHTVCNAYGTEHIAFLARIVLYQGDISAAVGVVFYTDYGCRFVRGALKVDHTIFLTVSAALVAYGDAASFSSRYICIYCC